MRASTRLVDWALTAYASDPVVAARFFKVNGLLDPPIRLLHPVFIRRWRRYTCAAIWRTSVRQ
jgi:hypothetical protein